MRKNWFATLRLVPVLLWPLAGCALASDLPTYAFQSGDRQFFNALNDCLHTGSSACPNREWLLRRPNACAGVDDMVICRDAEIVSDGQGTIHRTVEIEVARRLESHCMIWVLLVHDPKGRLGGADRTMLLRRFDASYARLGEEDFAYAVPPETVLTRSILGDNMSRSELCGK